MVNMEDLKEIINEHSMNFINMWLKSCNLMHIYRKENETNWIYLLYTESEDTSKIRVASLAKKNSGCEATFFGSLSHLVVCIACDSVKDGYKYPYKDEVYAKQRETEKYFEKLLNLPKNYFWQFGC